MDGVHERARQRNGQGWNEREKEGEKRWMDGWMDTDRKGDREREREGRESGAGDKRLRKPENRLSMMQGNQRN